MTQSNYTTGDKFCQGDVLKDVSASGRERPWRDKKMNNILLSMAYETIDIKKTERLLKCSDFLRYSVNADGKKKLEIANFCRVRLCPICTWRRSLKTFSQTRKILSAIGDDNLEYKYIFLTLTQKNVFADELSDAVDGMLKAFNALSKYKIFATAAQGWYRGMEITHNLDINSASYDTYHPHIHCLIAVKKSYFKSRDYIKQAKWTELWKKALRVSYTPVVDVRKCYGSTIESISEVAKYTVKDTDYIIPHDWDLTIDTVRLLDKVLNKRRFVAYGGAFKDYHKKLNLDDADEGDLIHVDEDDEQITQKKKYINYIWTTGYNQYFSE